MKKIIYLTIIVVTSAVVLVACNKGSTSSDEATNITEETNNSSSSSESESSSQSSVMINGIVVPPDPGEAGTETLIGIDLDSDGIRDDVERMIAESYGGIEKEFEEATNHAISVSSLLASDATSIDDEGVKEYIKYIVCSTSGQREIYSSVSRQSLNTPDRWSNYANKMMGATDSGVTCD